MTRALEVRLFWGDALLDVQHHPLREGLKVMSSAMLDGTATLASLERGALALAGERHGALNVLEHGALSIVMGVVELTTLDRGPREGQPLASACLLAMALHASLLAAGMASPHSDALSIDGLPRPLPELAQRYATVLSVGTNVSADAPGLPEATISPAPGTETNRSARRGGSRASTNPVRPNLLAMLGGVAMRFGSGAGGYDASSAIGAPMPDRTPDDDGVSMMHGARGVSCAPPPRGCNASNAIIAYGGHAAGFSGSGAGAPTDSELAFQGRCRPGSRCGVPILRCGGGPSGCAPSVTGGLSREAVRRVMHQRRNEYVYCYERALQARPDREGRVSTRFVIDPSGSVVHAEASSDTMPEVTECIERALSRAHFPESSGVTGVSYPFDFTVSE
jgi:hypothetical protein